MSIKMFIEFPGVLITIGVSLLVIAIIIGIISYKNEEKELEMFNELEDDDQNEITEEPVQPIKEETKEEPVKPVIEETKEEPAQPVIEEKEDNFTIEEPIKIEDNASNLELKQDEIYKPLDFSSMKQTPSIIPQEEEVELL